MKPSLSAFLQFLLFLHLPSLLSSKTVIEPCNSSSPCYSLLSYILPSDLKLSEIASKFQINVLDLLASNGFDPSLIFQQNRILPANSILRIPISCSCINGIRRSVSTIYTVIPIDNIQSIAIGFGGLVSARQIMDANGISDSSSLESGESLRIPLPCTCFNNSDNGVPAIYLSYVVQEGDSLGSIGVEYGTTVTDLLAVNGLVDQSIGAGDILAVPISACSSANLHLYNESLLVPNGGYALTAANCIQCSCGPNNLSLHCFPSSIVTSCNGLHCEGTHLFIGDVKEKQRSKGCNVTMCLYHGFQGNKIFSSLENTFEPQCSGNHSSLAYRSSPTTASSRSPIFPLISISPSPAPTLAPFLPIAANKQPSGVSVAGVTSFLCLLIWEMIIF